MRYIKLSGLQGSKTIVNIDHIVSVANVAVIAVFSADIAADIVMQYGTEIHSQQMVMYLFRSPLMKSGRQLIWHRILVLSRV